MRTSSNRFHALIGISLLLTACEKSTSPAHKAPPQEKVASRVTKSLRPLDEPRQEAPPAQHSASRESLEKALLLPTPDGRNQALSALIWDSLEDDPDLAQEAFKNLSAGSEEKNAIIKHFSMRLAEQNPDGAAEWAKSLGTTEEQSLAFGKIALVLSATNPEAAAKLLSDSGVASHDFDIAVVEVIQRWATQSPANAAAWVAQFEPGEARSAGLKEVASAWMEQDIKATISWIDSIQDSTIKEEAITGMALSILEFPDSRQNELLGMTSPEVRKRFEKLKAEGDQ
jgi:hypothetical protein